MNKIFYILSSSLDYSKLICKDAGPAYSKSMGWNIIYINQFHEFKLNEIYVIDNRISKEECTQLTAIISSNPSAQFILKVVDPFIEHINHYYYEWLIKMINVKNVRILTVYEPEEYTLFLKKISTKPILYIPYPYASNQELSLNDLHKRKNRIIISGALNNLVYPIRTAIWQNSRRSIIRPFYDTLSHPGYPDVSATNFNHHFIGQNYIQYLSNYKFMLLCGTRCKIELLKFHECAYAGCLPIGQASKSLKEIDHIFKMPSLSNLTVDTGKIILKWNELQHIESMNIFRTYLKENREKNKLNKELVNQL